MADILDGFDVFVDYEGKDEYMEYSKALQDVINDLTDRIKELERRLGDG